MSCGSPVVHAVFRGSAYNSKSTKSTQMLCRLNIEIHKIYKMNEIHRPKHQNPQHLGLYEIHFCLKVEINRADLRHMMSKSRSVDVFLCNSIGELVM